MSQIVTSADKTHLSKRYAGTVQRSTARLEADSDVAVAPPAGEFTVPRQVLQE